jgi:hypothetical protein
MRRISSGSLLTISGMNKWYEKASIGVRIYSQISKTSKCGFQLSRTIDESY